LLLALWLFTYQLWVELPRRLRGRLLNRWLWVRMHLLGQRWRMPRSNARALVRRYQKNRHLARWERNLLVHAVRYNRRLGFLPEQQQQLPRRQRVDGVRGKK
jgi:hypothetical protein